jgi:hypothetical protein
MNADYSTEIIITSEYHRLLQIAIADSAVAEAAFPM